MIKLLNNWLGQSLTLAAAVFIMEMLIPKGKIKKCAEFAYGIIIVAFILNIVSSDVLKSDFSESFDVSSEINLKMEKATDNIEKNYQDAVSKTETIYLKSNILLFLTEKWSGIDFNAEINKNTKNEIDKVYIYIIKKNYRTEETSYPDAELLKEEISANFFIDKTLIYIDVKKE